MCGDMRLKRRTIQGFSQNLRPLCQAQSLHKHPLRGQTCRAQPCGAGSVMHGRKAPTSCEVRRSGLGQGLGVVGQGGG